MISIFLSGSVKKGTRDTRDPSYFWTDEDIHQIQHRVNNGNVTILNPSSITIPSHLSNERYIADLRFVYESDLVFVDARTYKGIGIGAEMMFAKILGLPVICLAPPESEYRKTISVEGVLQNWVHPFIVGLSTTICNSLDDAINAINDSICKGAIPRARDNTLFAEALLRTSPGQTPSVSVGPYDDGYSACSFFWGKSPASHVKSAVDLIKGRSGLKSLDFGCGDGKNASYVASCGIDVHAIDISSVAIANAQSQWPNAACIKWQVSDIRDFDLDDETYDLVVSTGCLHCLESTGEVDSAIQKIQAATIPGGLNVISSFNSDAAHDFTGHSATFVPLLLPHAYYLCKYSTWEILEESSVAQDDIHPNTNLKHSHSITRLLARKPVE